MPASHTRSKTTQNREAISGTPNHVGHNPGAQRSYRHHQIVGLLAEGGAS